MIEAVRLVKRFGVRRVLDRLDLRVGAGEVLLLLGDNGSGKSTLLRCILGLHAYEGRVRVGGRDPLTEGAEVRRRTGYMPQRDGLHDDMSVIETLRFYGALRGAAGTEAQALLARARLEAAAEARVDEISGGMRQRLAFALALVGDPPLLLLDEPTASLDGWSRESLVDSVVELAGRGKTVVLATHDPHPVLAGLARPIRLCGGRLQAVAAPLPAGDVA